ncbi:MAG: hypothetical protein ACKPCM_00805 [Pseudanabaena sp.]
MFELDTWFVPENRSNAQKAIEAIELPYNCGKMEAEIIAERFLRHQAPATYMILQSQPVRLLS